MRKTLAAMLLAVVMVAAMLPTVFAADAGRPSLEEGIAAISFGGFDSVDVEQDVTVYTIAVFGPGGASEDTISAFNVIKSGTTFTVSHVGDDDQSFIYIGYYSYTLNTETTILSYDEYDDDLGDFVEATMDLTGQYSGYHEWPYYLYNRKGYDSIADGLGHYWDVDGGFDPDEYVNHKDDDEYEDYSSVVMLHSGESVTFALPDDGHSPIYELFLEIYYPQYEYYYTRHFYFRIDNELFNANYKPEGPTEPEPTPTPTPTLTPTPEPSPEPTPAPAPDTSKTPAETEMPTMTEPPVETETPAASQTPTGTATPGESGPPVAAIVAGVAAVAVAGGAGLVLFLKKKK